MVKKYSITFLKDLIIQVATLVASEMVRKQMGLGNAVGVQFWTKTLNFLQKSRMLGVGAGVLISKPHLIARPISMVAGKVKSVMGFGPSKAVALVESGNLAKLNSRELRMVISGLSQHPVVATVLLIGGAAASTSVFYLAVKGIMSALRSIMKSEEIRISANARAVAEFLTKGFVPTLPLAKTIQSGGDVVAFLEQRSVQKAARAQLVMLYNKHKDILLLEESLKILNPEF